MMEQLALSAQDLIDLTSQEFPQGIVGCVLEMPMFTGPISKLVERCAETVVMEKVKSLWPM